MTLHKNLLTAFLLSAATAGAATLTLDNPTVYGLPGQTVGFGFTISSTPDLVYDGGRTPYLVITSAAFEDDPGTYPVGVFTDYIAQDFTVIGPEAGTGEVNPFRQPFDASKKEGIGAYSINSFQAVGDEATGDIVLTYDEFSVSPNSPGFDPSTDTLAVGQLLVAPASILVGNAPASVPEPGTFPAVSCALGMGMLAIRAAGRGFRRER